MKIKEIQVVHESAVHRDQKVIISATKQEADELRSALAVVDKFRKAAMHAAKINEKDSDVVSYQYAVKTDTVFVYIKEGAIG